MQIINFYPKNRKASHTRAERLIIIAELNIDRGHHEFPMFQCGGMLC